MSFFSNLFGEKKPTNQAGNKAVSLPGENPFTTEGILNRSGFFFKCPTCPNALSTTLQQIDQIIGVNVACQVCKNISHVPGAYKNNANPQGMKITGGVQVPISKFSDWYFRHPMIEKLIKTAQSDMLNSYGLYAFCSSCYHQFPATVLGFFAVAGRTGGMVFNARTPDSARDIEALRAGYCPQCRNTNLIVIATDIPIYVQNAIAKNKR